MKKNKTITALCVSLLALSNSNSLVYAATTQTSSIATSSQNQATKTTTVASSSSTATTGSSKISEDQSTANTSTSSQTVSVSSLDGNDFLQGIGELKLSNDDSSYQITSASDFVNWTKGIASGKYDATRNVYLNSNLDLTGRKVASIKEFKGTFEGCGHTISNLSYDNSSSSSFIDDNSGSFKNVTFAGLNIKGNDHYFIRNNSGNWDNVKFQDLTLSGMRAYLLDRNSGLLNKLTLSNVVMTGEAESIIHNNAADLSNVTVDNLKATGSQVDFIETNSGNITAANFTAVTFNGDCVTFIKTNSGNLVQSKFINVRLDGANSEAEFIKDNNGNMDTVSFNIKIAGNHPHFTYNNNGNLANLKFDKLDIKGEGASFAQSNGGIVTGAFIGKIEGEDACFINVNNGSYDFQWTKDFQVLDHITNYSELVNFSNYVNQGQENIDAILDNNIDAGYCNFKPIASPDSGKTYRGTFDGNGKSIYKFHSEMRGASFIYRNAGTVKHLEISGQVFGAESDFVSYNEKSGVIRDCAIILDITGEVRIEWTFFGMGKLVYGASANSFERNDGTIENVFYAGRLTNIPYENDPNNREGNVHNFYYLDQFGVIGGNAIRRSKWQIENGQVTKELSNASTVGWMQVKEGWHYNLIKSRPGFSGNKGDLEKPNAEMPDLSYKDIDRTEKSLRVTKHFDTSKYGEVRYELLDKDGHLFDKGWQTSPEFTGLTPGTDYQIAVRYEGNSNYLPSDATVVKVRTKDLIPKFELTENDIRKSSTSLEVTKQFETEKYGPIRYELKDTQGQVVKAWQTSPKFNGLTPGTDYQVVVQYQGNDNYVASDEVSVTVKTTKEAIKPEFSKDDIKRTDTTLKVTKQFETEKYGQVEYELKDSDGKVIRTWQTSPEFAGLTPDTEYTISVRYKGNDNYLASAETSVTVKTKKTAEPKVNVDNIYGTTDSFSVKNNPDTNYGNVNYEITDNQGKTIKNGQKQNDSNFSGLDLKEGEIYQIHVSYTGNDEYAPTEKVIKVMKAPTVTIADKNANSLKVADLVQQEKYGQAEYALSPKELTEQKTSSTISGLEAETAYTVFARYIGKDSYPPSAIGQVRTETDKATYQFLVPATLKTGTDVGEVGVDPTTFNIGNSDSVKISIIGGVSHGKVTLTRQNDPTYQKLKTRVLLNGVEKDNGDSDEIKVVDYDNENYYQKTTLSFTDPRANKEDNPITPAGFYTGKIDFKITYNKEGNK